MVKKKHFVFAFATFLIEVLTIQKNLIIKQKVKGTGTFKIICEAHKLKMKSKDKQQHPSPLIFSRALIALCLNNLLIKATKSEKQINYLVGMEVP